MNDETSFFDSLGLTPTVDLKEMITILKEIKTEMTMMRGLMHELAHKF